MAGLRPFLKDDIPQVADLVWKVLHERVGASPPELHAYFREVFFESPWQEDGIVSRVVDDADGKITAFFGTVARRMNFQGKTIRLAFGSNFVVDPASRASMSAVQLIRAMMKGPQDISITDSANESSRQMLRSLGFTVVPVYSLLWTRPLRPAAYFFQGVARLKKSKFVRALGTISRPFNALTDAVAVRAQLSPFRRPEPDTLSEDLDIDTHLHALAGLPKNWLLPEYDRNSLKWIIDFVEKNKTFGDDIRKRVVRDTNNKVIGWYVYYVNPGDIGEVVQIGAVTGLVGKVLDNLFYDAWKQSLIGLHGRLEPQFMEELTLRSCFFLRNGSWTLAHSSRADLLALIQGGTAFFSRLDGEWSLRPPRIV